MTIKEVATKGQKERRITESEEKRFHTILNDCIEKLNSKKNSEKSHWEEMDIVNLYLRFEEEKKELEEAIFMNFPDKDIESECYDVINFALFMIDNLRGNK